jgi:dTDP-4-dehydrorhamnose reductase
MTVLLLGAMGQLGLELKVLLSQNTNRSLIALSRKDLDLTKLDALEDCLKRIQPEIIFNASAYTAVDQAQSQVDSAETINHHVPERLARYAKGTKSVLIHYSTDFVFDGQKQVPYLEEDSTAPLNVYGQSKLAGERAIQNSGCQHLIFRTSWLMGSKGQNFLKTMLRLAKEKKQLRVVADQVGSPTSAKWLAQISVQALERCISDLNTNLIPPWGLYHASSRGEVSWHTYAKEAIVYAQQLGARHQLNTQAVIPISSSEYPLTAKRPVYSVLSQEKLKREFNIDAPDWLHEVHKVIEEIRTLGGLN